jgi:hypothetical protein
MQSNKTFQVVSVHVIGNTEHCQSLYAKVGRPHSIRRRAAEEGLEVLDHDDFLVVETEGNELIKVMGSRGDPVDDWEDDDFAEVATALGLTWMS